MEYENRHPPSSFKHSTNVPGHTLSGTATGVRSSQCGLIGAGRRVLTFSLRGNSSKRENYDLSRGGKPKARVCSGSVCASAGRRHAHPSLAVPTAVSSKDATCFSPGQGSFLGPLHPVHTLKFPEVVKRTPHHQQQQNTTPRTLSFSCPDFGAKLASDK